MTVWVTTATGLDLFALAWCLTVVFLASVIRGFSGFGLSALLVTSMSLILPPSEIVPVTLLLEAVASLALFPSIRRDLDRNVMWGLLAGGVPALPVGAWLLVSLPDTATRVVLSVLVIAASLLVWRGVLFRRQPGLTSHAIVGVVSGTMFGIAAIGGLPVVIYLLAASKAAATIRAVLALHLMLMGLYGAAITGTFGLLTVESLWRVLFFIPPLLAGIVVGSRHFAYASQRSWRRFTLALLLGLATIGLIRAVIA